jgi:hypothetical protein
LSIAIWFHCTLPMDGAFRVGRADTESDEEILVPLGGAVLMGFVAPRTARHQEAREASGQVLPDRRETRTLTKGSWSSASK